MIIALGRTRELMCTEKISYRTEIGRQVAKLRSKRGLSTRQLADLCGVNYANIGKIERGAYNVSVDILGKVCDALGARLRIVEDDLPGQNNMQD